MKKITILAFVAGCILCGCADMLNLEPHSSVSPTMVGSGDIEALRTGMYWKVQEAPSTYSYIAGDVLGGNLTGSNGICTETIDNFTKPLASTVGSQWNGYYKALLNVNNVLGIAEGLNPSETRSRVIGECHFFRAWIYLCLASRFGDVPILKVNTQNKVSRDPVAEVWKFVKEELDAAETCLAGMSAKSKYYVGPDAVTALKARVMLYTGDMEKAAAAAESLLKSGKYKLDSFEKIFRGEANSEEIFTFPCLLEDGSSIKISNQYYAYNHPNKGSYNYRPVARVMEMWESGDLRKAISVTTLDGLNFINKYPSGQTSPDPVVIFRIGEMYLISAEALGRTGGGLARLNELRKARGLGEITSYSDEEFLDAVLSERDHELLGEGHRWFDLVRTGKAVETIGLHPWQVLMPLPGNELKYNPNLTQNPGF